MNTSNSELLQKLKLKPEITKRHKEAMKEYSKEFRNISNNFIKKISSIEEKTGAQLNFTQKLELWKEYAKLKKKLEQEIGTTMTAIRLKYE